MKVEKTQKTVATTFIVEETLYRCDDCDYNSKNRNDVLGHIANKHAVKETARINDVEFILVDTKEDIIKWAEAHEASDRRINFVGPGWYGIERVSDNEDDITYIEPAINYQSRWVGEIKERWESLYKLEALLK